MNKNIKLAVLSALTLAGGSWVAAQQDEPARRASSDDERSQVKSAAQASEDADTQEVRPAEPPRASAGARTIRSTNRAQQDYRFPSGSPDRKMQEKFNAISPAFSGQRIDISTLARTHEMHRMSPEDAARMRAFQDAIRELRGSKDDESKAAAREEVTRLVSEQLDADLENRESELAAIEQRAKELRKQLDERKTAKPELLKMLVMLVDNPQVGLGIPPEWMQMLMRGQPNNNQFQAFGVSPDLFFNSTNSPPEFPPNPPSPPDAPATSLDTFEPASR